MCAKRASSLELRLNMLGDAFEQYSKVFLRLFMGGHPRVKAYVMQGPGEFAQLYMVEWAAHPMKRDFWLWQHPA